MDQDSFHADRRLIEALKERAEQVSCSEGRVLFSQRDAPTGLYIVEHGEIALVMKSESDSAVNGAPTLSMAETPRRGINTVTARLRG